jgi:hypothetical protein
LTVSSVAEVAAGFHDERHQNLYFVFRRRRLLTLVVPSKRLACATNAPEFDDFELLRLLDCDIEDTIVL